MANIGRFLAKHFKGKPMEFYLAVDYEWINYAEASVVNGQIIKCIFVDYDVDSGVLVCQDTSKSYVFFLNEEHVSGFWPPGFQMAASLKSIMKKNYPYANTKKDIMES